MRTTLLWQTKAQYQWHRHVPLIRFTGSRKALWETKPAQTAAAAGNASAVEAINFWELPARYRPLPITEAEIEAIESGGASLA
ncbi:hypothetical protein IWW49_005776 [Coemansia sp. RSA 1797]|nr:hypothetical protein IWW49_005776 [Coemansia sp. RSA 1797]